MSSGPNPPTTPATGTSTSTARPRPDQLPLAAASIRASSSVAAATTHASASMRSYLWTHQSADRSGRSAATRKDCTCSMNHFAPPVKKVVNAFITPPPTDFAAPLSRSPGPGMQPSSPPGPAAHGGPPGPIGGGGGIWAEAGLATRSSQPVNPATSSPTTRALPLRRIVELLEALAYPDELDRRARRGLPLHRHGPGHGGDLDQLPVAHPAQPQRRGRVQRLWGQPAVVAVQHHCPERDLRLGGGVRLEPVAEQAGAQQRRHTAPAQPRAQGPAGDALGDRILADLQRTQRLGRGHAHHRPAATRSIGQEPQCRQDPGVAGGGRDRPAPGWWPAGGDAILPADCRQTDSAGI